MHYTRVEGCDVLLIFIDSFPYSCLDAAPFLSSLPSRRPLIPGLGYSINIKAELFGGYRPDDVGWFNEWGIASSSSRRSFTSALRLLDFFPWNSLPDRAVHKLLGRLLSRNLLCLPLRYVQWFEHQGANAYEDSFSLPTIFSETPGLKKLLRSHFPSVKAKDEVVFNAAWKLLEQDTANCRVLFVEFGELDLEIHRLGVGTTALAEKIRQIDRWIAELWSVLERRNLQARLVVISDHGQANVHTPVSLRLEDTFGLCDMRRYLYFLDATMLRVWLFDDALKTPMVEYLSSLNHGQLLSDADRIKYGVVNIRFGDLIFILDEGKVFCPSFWGRKVPKAMHGYKPESPDQYGVWVANCNISSPLSDSVISTLQAHTLLLNLLRRES